MARPKGSRNALIRITYDDIGRLAGIAGDTARQYAHRGQFAPRDLNSLLAWVNARRAQAGQPIIGMPAEESPPMDARENGIDSIIPYGHSNYGLRYDPASAQYVED